MSVEKLRNSVASRSLKKMIPMLTKYAKQHSTTTVGEWLKQRVQKRAEKRQEKMS